jgi:protein-histidine pros-kinase
LSQILLNLTYNAIKFTETGEVKVELLRNTQDGHWWTEFKVIDTGIGIKPEEQDKLFQAFTQVDTSDARRHEGTGLGLHLSKKLAELLNGHISFQSYYGKGRNSVSCSEEGRVAGCGLRVAGCKR